MDFKAYSFNQKRDRSNSAARANSGAKILPANTARARAWNMMSFACHTTSRVTHSKDHPRYLLRGGWWGDRVIPHISYRYIWRTYRYAELYKSDIRCRFSFLVGFAVCFVHSFLELLSWGGSGLWASQSKTKKNKTIHIFGQSPSGKWSLGRAPFGKIVQ